MKLSSWHLAAFAAMFALGPSHRAVAQLAAVGPVSPDNGFPTWYRDAQGQQLDLCLGNAAMCLLPAAVELLNPTLPFPLNYGTTFPDEALYWAGDATMATNNGGQALLIMVLHGAFANGAIVPGDQTTFGRIRLRIDNLVQGATYHITTPYGVFDLVAQTSGRRGINFTQDVGLVPGDFGLALNSGIGPFLIWDSDLPIVDALGNSFIGDPAIEHTVTGSPTNNNFFRIDGPSVGGPGVDSISTNLFSVAGMLTSQVPAPVADFSLSPITGRAPLTVAFSDLSTGTIATRFWSFGDGAVSNVQNPLHVFSTAGTFTVSLTAIGPGGSNTKTTVNAVTVTEAPPVANFTANPTSGTRPLTVAFADTSTGAITSRSWAFGDGGTSTATNPTHVYTTAGNFTVSLTVTGPGGTDTRTTPAAVTVTEPPPVANFTANPTSGNRPLTVAFADTSTGGAITTRSWSFGDGGTSAAANPTHVYTTAGSFTVSLTVTGPGGTNTRTTPAAITVTEPPPVANFTANPTSGTRPLTVAFSNTSTGVITTRSWSFGDGGSSTAANPTHVYTTAGSFAVSLTVTGPGGTNTRTTPAAITVNELPPVANFTANPTSGTRPLTVAFTDASTGVITARSWTFGDGGTSTAANPTHVYTTAGSFAVSLTVTGPGGTNTHTTPAAVTVNEAPPVADFTATPSSGTVPLTVAFAETSTGVVTARSWNFGDGTTSTALNPTHVYSTAGTFSVTLTVTGPGGTSTRTRPGAIVVAQPPGALLLGPAIPGIAGKRNDFPISNASPSGEIWLLASPNFGSSQFTARRCTIVTGLADPFVLTAVPTHGGSVKISTVVSSAMLGITLHLQAIDAGNCSRSNLVSQTF